MHGILKGKEWEKQGTKYNQSIVCVLIVRRLHMFSTF